MPTSDQQHSDLATSKSQSEHYKLEKKTLAIFVFSETDPKQDACFKLVFRIHF